MTREFIGSIKLEPDATAPTAAAGVLYFDSGDTKLKICEDGATFVDVGTGGGGGYDAVVAATGGDYTTLGAAITGGATSIFVKDGTYAETGAITLPSNCTVVGESKTGTIINMQTNLLTIGEGNTLQNLHIKSSRDRALVQTAGSDVTYFNLIIENTLGTASVDTGACLSIDDGTARTNVNIIGCKFIVFSGTADNPNKWGVSCSAAGTRFQLSDCDFIGAGSSYSLYAFRVTGGWSQINDVRIYNFGKSGTNFCLFGFTDKATLNNFSFEGCVGVIEFDTNTDNVMVSNWTGTSGVAIKSEADYASFQNIRIDGVFTMTSNSRMNILNNSMIIGGLNIDGDWCQISNCRVGSEAGGGANTITIGATASDTMITNTAVDSAITDGGSDTVTDTVVY